MQEKKRILFVSTHNFATNPRLVKEIDLALESNYDVSVVCCTFDNWSKQLNEKIRQRLMPKITYHEISATRKPLIPWLFSSGWFAMAGAMLNFFPTSQFLLSVRSNKRSWLLMKYLKNLREKIHMVVAHNPGSFYPAKKYATAHEVPLVIDLEDYHPGETTNVTEIKRLKQLNRLVLPAADYITAAAPLILEYSMADLPKDSKQTELILNYFPSSEFVFPEPADDPKLNIVWFSQNIAKGRGLEEIIPVIKQQPDVALHLYGNMDKTFYNDFLTGVENIHIHEPLLQADLHHELKKYDAALALEKPASNLNRDLCITNKIMAYHQAGIFIIASDTMAQRKFINENPSLGMLVALNTTSLNEAMQKLKNEKQFIRHSAGERFNNARPFNWESESEKLLLKWNQLVH